MDPIADFHLATTLRKLRVRIVYAPLADELSQSSSPPASFEYSQRAAQLLRDNRQDWPFHVEVMGVEQLTDDASQLVGATACSEGESCGTLYIFVVSCAADGSLHRSVRKFARSIAPTSSRLNLFAVTLLGHARCENSAKQMKDTIYGSGRRFEQAISPAFAGKWKERCETQAELEGPETAFDIWIMSPPKGEE